MEQDKTQICTIKIMFPVKSDDEAIEYKKKIDNILSGIQDAHMQFNLMSPQAAMNRG